MSTECLKEFKKNHIDRVQWPGDKDLYHDWKAQFEIFVDQMKVPAKTKMMMLKNSLSGKPLRIVERLGYT